MSRLLVTNADGPTAQSYVQMDPREHAYNKPEMYGVLDQKILRDETLYDVTNTKMVESNIEYVPGCERLFLEIISNASDNVGRSRRAGVDPGKIDVVMTSSTISITNYGLPIPIEIHPEKKIYVPEMIFGTMFTSSNYHVDRHEVGTNGVGAKIVNIFSTEFKVCVHDSIRKLKYVQIWRNNMKDKDIPEITPYNGIFSAVQIIYTMDFPRFGYTEYPQEAYSLYARHCADISFTAKTVVTFNGAEFNYSAIKEYARLYFGDIVDTGITHYQWPTGTEIIKRKGCQFSKNNTFAEIEMIAIDTPDAGRHISFVNCMMSREGGIHVDAAVSAVAGNTVEMINDVAIKKLTKMNKGNTLKLREVYQ